MVNRYQKCISLLSPNKWKNSTKPCGRNNLLFFSVYTINSNLFWTKHFHKRPFVHLFCSILTSIPHV